MINTVLGPMSVDGLGITYMHEHLLIDTFDVSGDSNARLDDVEIAVDELAPFRQAGASTVVEVTPINVGRDVLGIREIARASGVNVILGTGIYVEKYHPAYVRTMSSNALADVFIEEATVGMDGHEDIKAGVIGEIGAGKDYVSPAEERVFRAAARAHKATGLPITTHAAFGRVGLQQIEILKEERVDLGRVIIGHMDTMLSEEYHLQVARSGVYVQFDTIGRHDLYPDARRIRMIMRLVELGYASRILFSQDLFRRSHLKAFGGPGYAYLLTHFIPQLVQAGLTEDVIDMILRQNPKEVLAPAV